MNKLRNIWLFIRQKSNKYVLVTLFFAILIGFVGDSSVYRRILNMRRLMELDSQIQKYNEEYERDTKQLEELKSSPAAVERTARERYFMKKPNEDVFVFEEDVPALPPGVSTHSETDMQVEESSSLANDKP